MKNKNIVAFYAGSESDGKIVGYIDFPGGEKKPEKQLALIAKALAALCFSTLITEYITKDKPERITPGIKFSLYVDFSAEPKPETTGNPTPEEAGALIRACLDSWLNLYPKFDFFDILAANSAAMIVGLKAIKPGPQQTMLSTVALSALLQSKIPTSAPGFAAEMIITTCDRLPRRTRFVVGLRAIASAIFGSFSH